MLVPALVPVRVMKFDWYWVVAVFLVGCGSSLKWYDYTEHSWWLVTSPLWGPFAGAAFFTVLAIVVWVPIWWFGGAK